MADVRPSPVSTSAMVGEVRVTLRSYLSTHHLFAARHMSTLAAESESQASAHSATQWRIGRSFAMGSVLSAVAFLEACINEVFQDAHDGHAGCVTPLGEPCLQLMGRFWRSTEHGGRLVGIQDKYDMALLFAGRPAMDAGRYPYQDVRLLIEVRNFLVHYKPSDVGEGAEHRLDGKTRGKFPGNKFLEGSGNAWFPDHALGAGCAAWSHRCASDFAVSFAESLGLELNFQRVQAASSGDAS